MATFSDQHFQKRRINIDGNKYVKCWFDHCQLAYSGGAAPRFEECTFTDNAFVLSGAAGNAVLFLTQLYKVAPEYVEQTFGNIRSGSHSQSPKI
jgi:hypothetical protein